MSNPRNRRFDRSLNFFALAVDSCPVMRTVTADLMPTLNFKGKAVIETYHHTVPHHRLEFDAMLSLRPTHAGKVRCVYNDDLTQPQYKGWLGMQPFLAGAMIGKPKLERIHDLASQ